MEAGSMHWRFILMEIPLLQAMKIRRCAYGIFRTCEHLNVTGHCMHTTTGSGQSCLAQMVACLSVEARIRRCVYGRMQLVNLSRPSLSMLTGFIPLRLALMEIISLPVVVAMRQ